jgi:hypothetical protein
MPWRRKGEWRCSSTILDLGTGWRSAVIFTPQSVFRRKIAPRYPLTKRRKAGYTSYTNVYPSIQHWRQYLICQYYIMVCFMHVMNWRGALGNVPSSVECTSIHFSAHRCKILHIKHKLPKRRATNLKTASSIGTRRAVITPIRESNTTVVKSGGNSAMLQTRPSCHAHCVICDLWVLFCALLSLLPTDVLSLISYECICTVCK